MTTSTLTPAELQQFNELQIRYRLLDNDRKSYAEKVTNQIRRQSSQIARLKAERDKLENQVADESAPLMTTKVSSQATSLMQTFHKENQLATKQVRSLESQSSDLDQQIKILRTKISEERRRLAKLQQSKKTPEDVERQIRILENRLNKATIRFNESVAQNKKLREEIDGLRQERSLYDGVFKKHDKRLSHLKESLRNLVDHSNLEYDERDSLQSALANLEKIELEEAKAFDSEWSELTRQLEQDKHLRELMDLGQKDTSDSQQSRQLSLKEKLINATMKDKNPSSLNSDRVDTFHEALARMQEVTGIHDINKLVSRFIEAESKNFSLFNYSNELGVTLDKLQADVNQINDSLSKISVEETSVDSRRKKLVDELEEQTQMLLDEATEYEKTCLRLGSVLNDLESAVVDCMDKIGINQDEINHLTNGEGVTNTTLISCLGLIEQRTCNIIAHYLYKHPTAKVLSSDTLAGLRARRDSAWMNVRLDSRDSLRGGLESGNSMGIVPPSTDYVSDDEGESSSRPLTREELKRRVEKEMRG
ncbi:hypothetical protein P9112_007924 [Eukaryota sp. TZLM1-RC]